MILFIISRMQPVHLKLPTLLSLVMWSVASTHAAEADLIFHNAKIVTVDDAFSIQEAMAVRQDRILAVGSRDEVFETRGPGTEVIDLEGRTVLPGLIDSHTHPVSAAMMEFDHQIPEMLSIQDVLEYIKSRAKVVPEGEWIVVQQVFITRLREQRYPNRAELDQAAPNHPVIFRTGPDASLNSLALQRSGIDRDFKVPDGVAGKIERDPDGEPIGILRNYSNFVQIDSRSGRSPSEEDYLNRLQRLFDDYNSVGLTAVADRNASRRNIEFYRKLREQDRLPVRLALSHSLSTKGSLEEIREAVRKIEQHPLRKPDAMLRIVGVKIFLDGGMLTGSAYMRKPWGVSEIYGINDPEYRGVRFVPPERLLPIVRAVMESGLQFTAHSVGDGAVHTLLGVYETLAEEGLPVKETRACITHCNFMSREAVQKMARLGVVCDIQPPWLLLDTRTLEQQFGYDRLQWFQPLKSLFQAGAVTGGGSDHMQKIGSFRSINPYNPFLGIETAITRKARWYEGRLHPEQALSREEAIRFYTRNNAYLLFLEEEIGSLEEGKRADFIVLDQDILSCPVEKISETRVMETYLDGIKIFGRQP